MRGERSLTPTTVNKITAVVWEVFWDKGSGSRQVAERAFAIYYRAEGKRAEFKASCDAEIQAGRNCITQLL